MNTNTGTLPISGGGVLESHLLLDSNALALPTAYAEPLLSPSLSQQSLTLNFESRPQNHVPTQLIGIIDSGFNVSDINLNAEQIWVGSDNTLDELDQNGSIHGSAIANIIEPDQTDILWLKDAVGSGKWADALIDFVDGAIASKIPHAIANLSFDLTTTDERGTIIPRQTLSLEEANALGYAQQNNVIVVVAAGNDGDSIGALGQASELFGNVITVGASDGLKRTDYSSHGTGLNILAPGGTSDRPLDTGINDYPIFGTSAATATVTGGIAKLWEANTELSYQQVLNTIEQSAVDIYAPGPDLDSGAGIFDIKEALALAQQTEPVQAQSSTTNDWMDMNWDSRSPSHTERPLGATSGRIQAEHFQLDGYTKDTFSNIKGISAFRDRATAKTKFNGPTGVYTLKVRYFDESDGQSSFEVKVGGASYKWKANGNYRDNYPSQRNGVIREIKNVVLTQGSTIQLIGHRDKGERARIDYVDFEPSRASSPSPSPGSSPAPSTTRRTIQAESFRLNGFTTENNSAASGGKLIRTSGSGRATTVFNGTPGRYDIKVNYFDEADGRSNLSLKAGGRTFNWTANKGLPGNVATSRNRTSKLFTGITLNHRSTIELTGQRHQEEYARIDSIELIPSNQASPSPSPRPIEQPIVVSPQSSRHQTRNGEFQVVGEHIYDPSGQEFIVKGVNKFTFDQGSNKTIDQIKNDWKFNTVRLNYFLEGESGQQLHPNIQALSNNKVVTIVEVHDKTGKYWEGGDLTRLKSWFKDLAKRYKDNPYVWFNIANEPGGSKSAQQTDKWLKQHQEVIKVIRNEVGASNPIVVDAHFWGQDVGEWNGGNVKESKSAILSHGDQLKHFGGKSYDNIIFSVHMYDQWNFGESKMANYLDRIEDKDHAVIVGEYGQINNGYDTKKATTSMFKVTAPREIGRIAWVWSAKDSNDLTTTKNGGGEHINHEYSPTNLSWLGQKIWADNRRRENLHRR